jgi:succinate dehydrogenase / fumarate reductase cytochrome b subunit
MAENPQKPAIHPRPLSPHLQIYHWPVTMATSITHRATGIALSFGTLLIAWWLITVATAGIADIQMLPTLVATPIGQIILFGLVWSLSFHLLNGIRHLAWDLGYGFAVPTANATGVLVIALSILLAIGAFVFAYAQRGVIHL